MVMVSVTRVFRSLLLLCAVVCILQPVTADNGTISIAYRGSGGAYIGESVVFDGRDTYGSTILIKIAGPGLPPEGVPVNNLNGPAGTGTPVEVDQYGTWKFVWYASTIRGIEKLKTGRYTFTATDSADPAKSATSSFMLKKPEYTVTASPDPVNPGNYVEIVGSAEQGMTTAKIEIKDAAGTVQHSFTSPVSSSGYFSYGFHVDMPPGQYTVTVSNPALKAPFGTSFSVVSEGAALTLSPVVTSQPAPAVTTGTVPADTTPEITSPATPVPVSSTSAKSPLGPVTVAMALITGIVVLVIFRQ
jgi:hypothetical protein